MNNAQRVSTAGLVALVVITTVLVGWALKSNDTTPATSPTAPAGSPAPPARPPAPSLNATPRPTSPATGTTPSPVPPQTLLGALDNQAPGPAANVPATVDQREARGAGGSRK